ncbi:MAG: hypothetical protein KA714_05945 [Limnoraphis sp. WC205]|nr:hypothetical protein [Limnoraphis sp. WC205]
MDLPPDAKIPRLGEKARSSETGESSFLRRQSNDIRGMGEWRSPLWELICTKQRYKLNHYPNPSIQSIQHFPYAEVQITFNNPALLRGGRGLRKANFSALY